MKCYILRSETYSVKPWKPHFCDVTSLASAPDFSEASLIVSTTLALLIWVGSSFLPTSCYFRWFSTAADLTSDFPKTWNSSGYIRISSQNQDKMSMQNHRAQNVCLALVQMGSTACGLTLHTQEKRKRWQLGKWLLSKHQFVLVFLSHLPSPLLSGDRVPISLPLIAAHFPRSDEITGSFQL